MDENGLILSADENVVKRYDFGYRGAAKTEDTWGYENSLIFTDKRVIRRAISPHQIVQKEVLLQDVNQVKCACDLHTHQTVTDNKKYVPLFIVGIVLLAIVMIVSFVKAVIVLGVISILGIIGLIIGLSIVANKKKTVVSHEATLKISIYGRASNDCIIMAEKVYDDGSTASKIANEIGAIILNSQSGVVGSEIIEDESIKEE